MLSLVILHKIRANLHKNPCSYTHYGALNLQNYIKQKSKQGKAFIKRLILSLGLKIFNDSILI